MILDIKDEVIMKLLKYGQLDSSDIMRLRGAIDKFKQDDIAAQMEESLSEYARKSFEEGIAKIDRFVAGEKLTDVLGMAPESLDIAKAYTPDAITTLLPEMLDDVQKAMTLGFLGQKTPQQIAAMMQKRFDVGVSHSETIARTEIKKMQNWGSRARMATTTQAADRIGIPMIKTWLHSSGSNAKAGKGKAGQAGRKGFAKGKARQLYESRPHHKLMHGVGVAASAKFHLVNAGTAEAWDIDGPYDPVLPAKEVVNCECDTLLKIDREAMGIKTNAPVVPPEPEPTPLPPPVPKPKPIKTPPPTNQIPLPLPEPEPQIGGRPVKDALKFKTLDSNTTAD